MCFFGSTTRYAGTATAGLIFGLILAIAVKFAISFLLAWGVSANFPLTYWQAFILTSAFTWLIDTIQSKKAA